MAIFVLLLLGATGFSQAVSRKSIPTGKSNAQVIEDYLNWNGPTAAVQVKPIYRMGDAAAVIITKLLGQQSLTNEKIEKILGILYMAFERPSIVQNVADQKPTATLILLQKAEYDDHGSQNVSRYWRR